MCQFGLLDADLAALLPQLPSGFFLQLVLESAGIGLHRWAFQMQPSGCPAPARHSGKDLPQDALRRGPIDPKASSNSQRRGHAGLVVAGSELLIFSPAGTRRRLRCPNARAKKRK